MTFPVPNPPESSAASPRLASYTTPLANESNRRPFASKSLDLYWKEHGELPVYDDPAPGTDPHELVAPTPPPGGTSVPPLGLVYDIDFPPTGAVAPAATAVSPHIDDAFSTPMPVQARTPAVDTALPTAVDPPASAGSHRVDWRAVAGMVKGAPQAPPSPHTAGAMLDRVIEITGGRRHREPSLAMPFTTTAGTTGAGGTSKVTQPVDPMEALFSADPAPARTPVTGAAVPAPKPKIARQAGQPPRYRGLGA